MPSRYLLDTNMVSFAIKGNFPSVRHHLRRVPLSDVAISAITEGELRFGVIHNPHATNLRRIVDEFLARIDILPWDSFAADSYARLRSFLESSGTPMGNLDMLIASQALAIGATLVTHDRVFHRVRNLKVEDWTK